MVSIRLVWKKWSHRLEGVGGPVDVAVITKNDGFTWLSRKSWYHHKDVNGMYGYMGK
ncbi:hypothetical protein [Prevotella sp. P3-122]|uniref:hypothetical protein n=1 Tax=Prevotella sp. P3-122 TaxID=2024223 RepID=UPI001482A907|nr:hypothetical protein [Prevotella sp. P3-122]